MRSNRVPDRSVGALCDAARGWRFRRSLYIKTVKSSVGEIISDDTATRDPRALTNAGLLDAVGETQGRDYQPSQLVRGEWLNIRGRRPDRSEADPYRALHASATFEERHDRPVSDRSTCCVVRS